MHFGTDKKRVSGFMSLLCVVVGFISLSTALQNSFYNETGSTNLKQNANDTSFVAASIGNQKDSQERLEVGRGVQVVLTDEQRSSSSQAYVVKSRDSFKEKKMGKLFKNKENIFRIEDCGSVIYFDDDRGKWYLHQFEEPDNSVDSAPMRLPLSWCLDMTDGMGGYISPTVEVELSHSSQLRLGGGFSIDNSALGLKADILKAAFGVSAAVSVRFTGSFTCNVKRGQYGQIFLRPYVYRVPEGKRVAVKFKSGKGLVEVGKWEKTPSYNRYWVRRPLLECATHTDRNLCTG